MSKAPEIDSKHYWKGYKIKLYPTDSQKEFIDRCIDLSRFVYNWALGKQIEIYEDYKNGKSKKRKYSNYDLDKMLSEFRNKPENNWLLDLPLTAGRYQIRHLNEGYNLFFKKKGNLPNFKSKKHTKLGSYALRNERMYFQNSRVKIEGLPAHEFIETNWNSPWYSNYTRRNGIINSPKFYRPTITRNVKGEYYLTFSIQVPKYKRLVSFDKINENKVIGIDLNINDRFVASNGYRSGSPNLEKLKRNRVAKQSRFTKDLEHKRNYEKNNHEVPYVESNRAKKRRARYIASEVKIANVVESFIQETTSYIIKQHPEAVCMEGLDTMSMYKQKHIARQVQNANFFRCKEVMKNKCSIHNITFIEASQYYPSSQLCSNCGYRQKIGRNKIYKCPNCGLEIDRDLNAAINLQHYALDYLNNN